MGKSHRGKPLRLEVKNNFRGKCPITGQSGAKLLYEHEIDGVKTFISKIGRATLLRRQSKKTNAGAGAAAGTTPAAADTTTAVADTTAVAEEVSEPAPEPAEGE